MSDQRTGQQRKSLEVYCREMAKTLNDAGYDQKALLTLFKDGFNVPWTQESYKDLFRLVAHAMYPSVESTADLDTIQIQSVYLAVDQRIAELTGVSVAWPSYEPPLLDEHGISV